MLDPGLRPLHPRLHLAQPPAAGCGVQRAEGAAFLWLPPISGFKSVSRVGVVQSLPRAVVYSEQKVRQNLLVLLFAIRFKGWCGCNQPPAVGGGAQ